MTTRTDVINFLIHKFGYKNYLEIGIDQKDNWNKIVVENKTGVDKRILYPDDKNIHCLTSDDFFAQNKNTYDIIFIDGCHVYEQVSRDAENSLAVIEKGGCIVFHDALPHCKEYTDPSLCGTVFKALLDIRSQYDYDICTLEDDHGVLVLRKDVVGKRLECRGLEWEEFYPRRVELFNAKSARKFAKYFKYFM